MLRCAPRRASACTRRLRLFPALLLAASLSAPAAAQTKPGHRVFPAHALRGELVVGVAPAVVLQGQADRLAPGARIRNESNLIVPPASLAGQPLTVHYTRETTSGLLLDVWILRPVELSNRPWPASEREAQRWTFDPAAQSWKKP